MKKLIIGKTLVVALGCILLFIVIYKALAVPITYDECDTAIYIACKNIILIMANPNGMTNNHILNTLSIKLSEFLFGIRVWSVRLPSVLSFLLLGACVYALANRYFARSWMFFCLPFLIVFCNPYLIDFYSLARGYGMANAFMVCSIFCMLLYSSSSEGKWYYRAIIFSMLAAYANFTFLIFWAAVQMLLVVMMMIKKENKQSTRKTLVSTVGLALGFAGLCVLPVIFIQHSIQKNFTLHEGFYTDTILNEINRFSYGNPFIFLSIEQVGRAVILVILIGGGYCLWTIRRGVAVLFADPLSLTVMLILLVAAINIFQVVIFKISYLSDRTALMYYVLFAFALMFLIRRVAEDFFFTAHIIITALFVFFGANFVRAVTLKSVYEWSYDSHTYDVLSYMNEYRLKHPDNKSIEVNTSWLYFPSISFYSSNGDLPWLKVVYTHSNVDTASETLFYYATADDATLLKNYFPVRKYNNDKFSPIPNSGQGGILMIHK